MNTSSRTADFRKFWPGCKVEVISSNVFSCGNKASIFLNCYNHHRSLSFTFIFLLSFLSASLTLNVDFLITLSAEGQAAAVRWMTNPPCRRGRTPQRVEVERSSSGWRELTFCQVFFSNCLIKCRCLTTFHYMQTTLLEFTRHFTVEHQTHTHSAWDPRAHTW